MIETIRRLNDLRKAAGLELTDRIHVVVPIEEAELLRHADWIKEEVLAVSLETDETVTEPRLAYLDTRESRQT